VYSLGVLLFRLLTGTYPFRSPLPIAIITQHIREKPPLITSIKPELSPELAAVVDKALAKKPEDRYQSAGELARALQATLGEPLETFNTPKAVSVTTVPKKRRVPSRVLVLALIGIVIIWIAILFVVLLSNLPV
jgi:serine/threonine protein kinase